MRVAVLVLWSLLVGGVAGAAPPAGVEVKVDARVELVAALFRLAGVKEYSGARESPYVKELEAWLTGAREHEAVAATRRLREKHDIGFDAPMQLALYLDPRTLRPLRPLRPRPPGLDERWEGVDVDAYVEVVGRFAEASRFRAFVDGQAARYAKVEARFRALAEKHDLRPWLDATYGPRAGARSVVVPGMQTAGMNFGITVALPGGGGDVLYQVLMLENVDGEGLPRPGDATLSLWAHEASHPYVNPLVEATWPLLDAGASGMYGAVAPKMRRQAYANPKITACESLVRAEVIRFLRARLGDKVARIAARDDDEKGFVWIDDLVAVLDASGDPLPKAMPAVAALFTRWGSSARHGFPRKPFRGPINAVYASGLRSVVYATAGVKAYAGQIAAKLGRTESPRAAEGVAWKDVERGVDSVAVYGAPASTPLVAELLRAHGERVAEEVIEVGGQRFATEGGAPQLLIVAHPKPGEAVGGVVVYTAARDEWVIGANNVFHGPTDWVVARQVGGKWVTIATGNF